MTKFACGRVLLSCSVRVCVRVMLPVPCGVWVGVMHTVWTLWDESVYHGARLCIV